MSAIGPLMPFSQFWRGSHFRNPKLVACDALLEVPGDQRGIIVARTLRAGSRAHSDDGQVGNSSMSAPTGTAASAL